MIALGLIPFANVAIAPVVAGAWLTAVALSLMPARVSLAAAEGTVERRLGALAQRARQAAL